MTEALSRPAVKEILDSSDQSRALGDRDKPDFVLGTCICRGQLCFWERGDRDSCLYDFHRDTEDSMAAPHVALRSEPAHEIGLSLA